MILLSTCATPFLASAMALGDVNNDGIVNNLDAVSILRHDAALITLSGEQYTVANVNFDGVVNNLDAIVVLKYDAGIINSIEGSTSSCSHTNTCVINLVDATVDTDGYSGDIFCNDCQNVISGVVLLEKFDYLESPITYTKYSKSNGATLTLPTGVDVLQYTLKRANKSAISSYPEIEARIFELINEERIKAGVAPLENQSNAYYYSAVRANECIELFSHTRPNETSFYTVFDDGDIFYRRVGENLFYCSGYPLTEVAELSVESWMNSEGHRNNLLNENFKTTAIGVTYVEETGKFYAVQLFMA